MTVKFARGTFFVLCDSADDFFNGHVGCDFADAVVAGGDFEVVTIVRQELGSILQVHMRVRIWRLFCLCWPRLFRRLGR